MKKEELVQRQVHISTLIRNIEQAVQGMDYEGFRMDEGVKEQVYEYLQELGEASKEVSETADDPIEMDLYQKLADFRNARYNQEAEIDHQFVWSIIVNDLPKMEMDIEEDIIDNEKPE